MLTNLSGLSDAQWKKIWDFFNKMPEFDALDENWRITLVTNRGRNLFYTYREFLQCLCINDCLKYAGGVELAQLCHLLLVK